MPAPRGGAKRREPAARFTSRRCARWLAGERLQLWPAGEGLRRKKRAGASDDERSSQQLRCRQLAAEGELSRACAALVAPPLIRHSPGVMDTLRAKHPRAQPARAALLPLGPPARTDVLDIAAADVVAAVRSFCRGVVGALLTCRTRWSRPSQHTGSCQSMQALHYNLGQSLVRCRVECCSFTANAVAVTHTPLPSFTVSHYANLLCAGLYLVSGFYLWHLQLS